MMKLSSLMFAVCLRATLAGLLEESVFRLSSALVIYSKHKFIYLEQTRVMTS